jgi:hypothetical protein
MKSFVVLFTFLTTVYVFVWYVNFNLPAFLQLFAHYTFSPVVLSDVNDNDCSSINNAICIIEPWGIGYVRNDNYCGQRTPPLKYEVNSREYILRNSNFLFDKPCHIRKTIFYFSPNPNWSVADNSFPQGMIAETLIKSTGLLACWLVLYAAALRVFLGSCGLSRVALEIETSLIIKPKSSYFLVAVFVAFTTALCVRLVFYALDMEFRVTSEFAEHHLPTVLAFIVVIGLAVTICKRSSGKGEDKACFE